MLKGQPPRNCIAYYEEMKHKIYELTSRQPFDIVHVEQSQMAPYIEFVSSATKPACLVTLYDVGAAQYERIMRIQTGFSSARVLTWLDWFFLRHWESKYLACQFDQCIVVSSADQALLSQANPHLKLAVVPNGVDTVQYKRLPRLDDSKEILFIGKMNYPPNVDGVLFFYHEIFPLVRRQVPEARLLIVGAEPSAEVQALGNDPTVRMIGQVEDVVPYYQRAYLSAVTLRAGGGTRLKILEAMALGRPVVTTMLGCEGLEVSPGENILAADTPQCLAAHIIRLFNDKDAYDRLVANGRRLVESRYDWRIAAQSLLHVYDMVAPTDSRAQK
jgi:glycosyltransferase involved in cell wall biosynthesis